MNNEKDRAPRPAVSVVHKSPDPGDGSGCLLIGFVIFVILAAIVGHSERQTDLAFTDYCHAEWNGAPLISFRVASDGDAFDCVYGQQESR